MNKLWFFPLVILVCVFVLWIASLFMPGAPPGIHSEGELWSHRGIHLAAQENSPEAVRLAMKKGFNGVELDVFYDETLGLVVSHDRPYKTVDGELVLLRQIFDEFDSSVSYWIDLKNLSRSNRSAVKMDLDALTEDREELRSGIFIESSKGMALKFLSRNFNCIYWVQYSRSFPKRFIKLVYIKTLLVKADFAGITTDHRYIDDSFEKHFRNLSWYVFTVNDPERIAELRKRSEVRVILTDLESPYVFSSSE